ncbi:MAG: hypothetical protein AAF086_05525 [Planctomycetota bacterium]
MTRSEIRKQLINAIREHAELDDEQMIDAANYGADAGFSRFIYTDDAAAFFDRHGDLIWDLAVELVENLGEANPLAMIAKFGRSDMSHSLNGFKTLMAWFALEEAGRHLKHQQEESIYT